MRSGNSLSLDLLDIIRPKMPLKAFTLKVSVVNPKISLPKNPSSTSQKVSTNLQNDLPLRDGSNQCKMLHKSSGLFCMGVPVNANRYLDFNRFTPLVCFAFRFFNLCASSATIVSHFVFVNCCTAGSL